MHYMNTQCFPKLMKKCCICSNDKNVNKSQILWWHTNNKIHIKWRNAQKLLHFIWINTTIIVYQALIRVKYKWNIVRKSWMKDKWKRRLQCWKVRRWGGHPLSNWRFLIRLQAGSNQPEGLSKSWITYQPQQQEPWCRLPFTGDTSGKEMLQWKCNAELKNRKLDLSERCKLITELIFHTYWTQIHGIGPII